MTELQRNHRQHILSLLRLLTSREEQLRYQREVPFGPVTVELFCQWDACYYPRDKDWFLATHPAAELAALDAFHHIVAGVRSELPDDLPPIEDFITMPQWDRLASGAAVAL